MELTPQTLIDLTRQALPGSSLTDGAQVSPMSGGASDRRYWRLQSPAGSLIICHYTHARPDNLKFLSATRILQRIGASCPEVLAHDEGACLMWIEDLGTEDLWAHRKSDWPARKAKYQAALRNVAKLHNTDVDFLTEAERTSLEPEFDESLYEWERNYFRDHLVRPFLQEDWDAETAGMLTEMGAQLAALPKRLVHRDLQSQNILLLNDRPFLIDYQGLRLGRPEYDTASLLYDPYVALSRQEREELRLFHASLLPAEDAAMALKHAPHAAAQRLMQALGAYGNLTRNLGKPHYFSFIRPALDNLLESISETPELAPLSRLVISLKKAVPASPVSG